MADTPQVGLMQPVGVQRVLPMPTAADAPQVGLLPPMHVEKTRGTQGGLPDIGLDRVNSDALTPPDLPSYTPEYSFSESAAAGFRTTAIAYAYDALEEPDFVDTPGFDPVTGQLTSAGYTLSPEAKNAQDRLVKLAESGLVQAEGAQQAFEPLQTGAQSLFKLGQGYLAETPEAVAANYLKSQMALLQPGREIELANLQNRLAQQGRTGLSVAQGGTMGATTPELQALFNARARQEAELAANAQLAGQAQIQYGAGLLGQGAGAMGQYYGGQQASYAPFTTALGQVQGLEQLAQQPLQMGASLGQTASTAGTNVGKLGLTGAQLSTNLATSANATANPYAQALMAAGNPNAMFGQSLGNVFGGLFS